MKTTKSIFFLIVVLSFQLNGIYAQYPNHALPQYPVEWNSKWITHPDIDKTAYGLIHLRKTFALDAIPEAFIVHVSGDNRYRLYVNEKEVCYGPQAGDVRHWRYETLDLAPFLQKGKNTVAAEVMNWGVERSHAIISYKTGFLLQGNSKKEQAINTNNNDQWKVLKMKLYMKKLFFGEVAVKL